MVLLTVLLSCTTSAPPGGDAPAPGDDTGDCSGPIVEWFHDADGDGFGAESAGSACAAPAATSADAGDCDDGDPGVHPGAEDLCDDVDQDCDAETVPSGVAVDAQAGFESIGAALAVAGDGSTVFVCAGTYRERLDIARSVAIVAPAGPGLTTLDAQGAGPAVTVRGGSVRLEGLTIMGGVGGGVVATEAEALDLVDCEIRGNEGTNGAGVTGPAAGTLRVEGGRIADNVADDYGGGVYGHSVWLDGVEVSGNRALDGGGLFVDDEGAATVVGTTFDANTAYSIGGSTYIGIGASLDARDSTWVGNESGVYAAGLYLDEASAFTDVGGRFEGQVAQDQGGAIYARYATVSLDGSAFVGNWGRWGGAVFLYGASLSALGASFSGNQADLGGAFYVYAGSDVVLEECTVEANYALDTGVGGGARLRTDATLVSTRTGWGQGALDNLPDDVEVSSTASFTYADIASFTCSTETGTCE